MQVTVQGKISPSESEKERLDKLMRLQSSCMRYSYNRICEGRSKSEIEGDLREKFSEINSRYRRDGYFRAKFSYGSAREQVKAGELRSPEKVVFARRQKTEVSPAVVTLEHEHRDVRHCPPAIAAVPHDISEPQSGR